MKIAAPYTKYEKLPQIDEYNIEFDSKENNKDKYTDFVRKHQDVRINILFKNSIDFNLLSLWTDLHKNLYVRVDNRNIYNLEKIKEYKWFLDKSVPINSFISLQWAIKNHPSDIYITDDLCYNIPHVRDICDVEHIKIRIILNRIPSTFYLAGELEDSPIYQPQDFALLNLYYDTCEFDCYEYKELNGEIVSKYNWDKFKILYRRWFEEHGWNEDLRYLNNDIAFDYPNKSIMPYLTEYKIKCKHKCIAAPNSICDKCKKYVKMGQSLAEKGYGWNENRQRSL